MTHLTLCSDDAGTFTTQGTRQTSAADAESPKFEAIDLTQASSLIDCPGESWITLLQSPCTFPPDVFGDVMLNLVKNPNVTSSHLFRADVLIDSTADAEKELFKERPKFRKSSITDHVRKEFIPKGFQLPTWTIERTIVRQLIPRNVQLDQPLIQTCHFLARQTEAGQDEHMVVYIPHIEDPEDMPFYHPSVSKLAFHHQWSPALKSNETSGSIAVSYCMFPETQLSSKLRRTGLRLLQTIHKHGQGQLAGYEKRVHLDQIIPQRQYQDTYARLKITYGKSLADNWVEVTDPGKHVFEDIGIAAFLIELWATMYERPVGVEVTTGADLHDADEDERKPAFPGFVDIGCGNGILTYILISEGYPGSGFDARRRKTWSTFPEDVQARLQQCLLVPDIFLKRSQKDSVDQSFHNGYFTPGTFIISNHADELTAWTPLLAYLNTGSFIAIPCCSHDLAGARFRAPATVKSARSVAKNYPPESPRLPQQLDEHRRLLESTTVSNDSRLAQAAETGSLKRTLVQKKMASAYATLCSYIVSLTDAVGYEPEKEVLRIPSTRNQSIIGRRLRDVKDASAVSAGTDGGAVSTMEGRERKVVGLVEEELGKSITTVAAEWIERVEKLEKKPGSGH